MRKISSYLYPNRIELLADLAAFTVEYQTVYQRNVKIYKGINNVVEFDVKNAEQKRIDLTTLEDIKLYVMDASGNNLPNSPYVVTPTALKGIATATIPSDDLESFTNQFFRYSVTALKDEQDIILYADTKFGGSGTIEFDTSLLPASRPSRVYDSFTGEIDLKGMPTYSSSSIPAKFYEAIPTQTLDFDIELTGFVGSVWISATKSSTISVESFKNADFVWSATYTTAAPGNTPPNIPPITIGEYQYFRVSFNTPTANGVGAQFTVTKENGNYNVELKSGGTNYSVGSQLKVLGSVLGGVDGINDLIINVTAIDAASTGYISSYVSSSIVAFSSSGTAAAGPGIYIVTGRNITGKVDKVTVS
jgi:hypothetical protein